jgi:Tfp pilus assembly protein PilO
VTASRDRTRLLLGLAVAAPLLLVGNSSLPHYQQLEAKAAAQRGQAATVEAQAQAAENFRAHQASFDALLGAYQDAIPATPQLPEVLNALQAAAASSGVTWTAGSPSQGATGQHGLPTWNVAMSLTGTAAQVGAFTDAVRALPRLVVIDSVALSVSDGTKMTASVNARFFARSTSNVDPATKGAVR